MEFLALRVDLCRAHQKAPQRVPRASQRSALGMLQQDVSRRHGSSPHRQAFLWAMMTKSETSTHTASVSSGARSAAGCGGGLRGTKFGLPCADDGTKEALTGQTGGSRLDQPHLARSAGATRADWSPAERFALRPAPSTATTAAYNKAVSRVAVCFPFRHPTHTNKTAVIDVAMSTVRQRRQSA